MNLPVLESSRGIHRTDIEWADYAVGSPFLFRDKGTGEVVKNACVKVSSGCANCYAEQIGLRFKTGRPYTKAEMERLECVLDQGVIRSILNFRPSPEKGQATFKNGRSRPAVFLGDMTDIFGEWVPFDMHDYVYAAMALRPDVDWLLLTKRPERMAEYLTHESCSDNWAVAYEQMAGSRKLPDVAMDYFNDEVGWPLPNVWHGCSAENRKMLDERGAHLLRVPGVRFLSLEPLLEGVNVSAHLRSTRTMYTCQKCGEEFGEGEQSRGRSPCCGSEGDPNGEIEDEGMDWVILGGESGKGARPYNLAWARSIIEQCAAAGVPCFHKQVGSSPIGSYHERLAWCGESRDGEDATVRWKMRDSKGGDPTEWPEDLRVRQMPGGGA